VERDTENKLAVQEKEEVLTRWLLEKSERAGAGEKPISAKKAREDGRGKHLKNYTRGVEKLEASHALEAGPLYSIGGVAKKRKRKLAGWWEGEKSLKKKKGGRVKREISQPNPRPCRGVCFETIEEKRAQPTLRKDCHEKNEGDNSREGERKAVRSGSSPCQRAQHSRRGENGKGRRRRGGKSSKRRGIL